MELIAELDGNSLCIKGKDFKNLQESPSVFIELTEEPLKQIKALESKKEEKFVEERFEFDWKGVNDQKHIGIVFDTVYEKNEVDKMMGAKAPSLVISSPDGFDGPNSEHTVWGVINFRHVNNLELFQKGLELMKIALAEDEEEE